MSDLISALEILKEIIERDPPTWELRHIINTLLSEYGWHPVSELPEANKAVLASSDGGVVRAVYVPPFTNTVDNYEGDDEVYNEENDEYYWPKGWYEWNLYDEIHYRINEPVIAWMPLPDPYKKEE